MRRERERREEREERKKKEERLSILKFMTHDEKETVRSTFLDYLAGTKTLFCSERERKRRRKIEREREREREE